MKGFTNSRMAFQLTQDQLSGGVFIRIVLYLCIVCLLNTLFFSVIKRPAPSPEQLTGKTGFYQPQSSSSMGTSSKIIKIKVAKSILRFILGTVLVADNPDNPGPQENKHEELHRMDYIPPFYICLIHKPFIGVFSSLPYRQPLLGRPFIDMLTPPPKA